MVKIAAESGLSFGEKAASSVSRIAKEGASVWLLNLLRIVGKSPSNHGLVMRIM